MLKKLFVRFSVIILILSILLVIIEQIILSIKPELISVAFPWLVILFLIVSSTFHYFILKSAQENPRKFVNVFLLATTLKLLLYFSTMLVVVFMFNVIAKTYILNFAFLYLVYTVLEVYLSLTQLKKISSNKLNNTPLNQDKENIEK